MHSCKEKDVIRKTNTFTNTICSLGIEIISNEVNSSGSNLLELTYFSQLLFACRGQWLIYSRVDNDFITCPVNKFISLLWVHSQVDPLLRKRISVSRKEKRKCSSRPLSLFLSWNGTRYIIYWFLQKEH